MAVNNIIKRIQNIMRQDAGINGDAQRIEQMTWMFFLKVYDTQEETWEYKDDNYKSIIPEELRWRNWAVDEKDGEALTGEALLSFVNEKLFPALKNLKKPSCKCRHSTSQKYCSRNICRLEPVYEKRNASASGNQHSKRN